MSAEHAPGPLTVDSENPVRLRDANDDLAADCDNSVFTDDGEVQLDTCIPTARLLAAAYNSYNKHCGPDAIACAEGDLLGRALSILSRMARIEKTSRNNRISTPLWMEALALLEATGGAS